MILYSPPRCKNLEHSPPCVRVLSGCGLSMWHRLLRVRAGSSVRIIISSRQTPSTDARACGGSFRGLWFIAVFRGFKCTSRSPQSSLGRMGRSNTSAVAAPNSGTAPQFNQSSSLNWTVSHASTLGGIKHPSMKRKLSTCGKCVICNHFYLTNVLFPG